MIQDLKLEFESFELFESNLMPPISHKEAVNLPNPFSAL